MEYIALIKEFGEKVEEEVTVLVNGIMLTGFMNVYANVEIGKKYNTEISLTVLDDLEVVQIYHDSKRIERIGDTFAYYIYGQLLGDGRIDSEIIFEDEELYDYPNLVGKFVRIRVDRINLEFLNQFD